MKIIGLIGFGNMGSAIFERLKGDFQFYVFDKDKNKLKGLKGVRAAAGNKFLIKAVDTAVLAIKPQDFQDVLKEISLISKGKLIISIAAGITTNYIEGSLLEPRVIRVMPNLAARIGEGVICLCKGNSATDDDLNFSQELFRKLGSTLVIGEDMMDAATAVSGSGPGFLYYLCEGKSSEEAKNYARDIFIPALARAARNLGFSPEQAEILAKGTAEGGIAFMEKSGQSPDELKKMVASKGGTTEAGLEVLQGAGTLEDAVKAAFLRSKELSRS